MQQISFIAQAAPGPAEGAYSARPDLIAGLKGPTSKEKGEELK